MNIRQKKLPIAVLQQIDDRCVAFEKAWQSGDPPSIESVLADGVSEDQHDVLLAELIALETDYRRRRGETPDQSEYLGRFPSHADFVRDAIDPPGQTNGPFVPPSIERVAELFPNLRIIKLLGAGGMGAVYEAKQEGLDRMVALKLLPEEFVHDAKFSLRFTREARTLAKLNHPNIVSVYEFGTVQGTFFFLMEHVDGPTLREVVRAGELAPRQALAIVPDLCDALQYAHDNGVIHRDIKPENILLTADGSVKIVDFGLSRILGSSSQAADLTGTHQVMGTPRYMAPEQFDGAHHVDHRADIYSLGVVFYELLTGELPMGRFAAPSTKVSIDVRLDEVVLRTLEREPQLRYQAASQVKSDLQSIADSGTPSLAVTQAAVGARQMAESDVTARQSDNHPSTARMLLDRRDLMGQVKSSLRPLHGGQVFQILVGILLIGVGAFCWAQNTNIPHRLISGVIVHLYGIAFIAAAIGVMTRIKRIDYDEPVDQVRSKLREARGLHLRLSPLIGFAWWLMWIPVGVACGFDVIMLPNVIIPSLIVGVIGGGVSLWLFYYAQSSGRPNAEQWKVEFAGSSFRNALGLIDQIVELRIR